MHKKRIQFKKIKNKVKRIIKNIKKSNYNFYPITTIIENYNYQWFDLCIPSKKNKLAYYVVTLRTGNCELFSLIEDKFLETPNCFNLSQNDKIELYQKLYDNWQNKYKLNISNYLIYENINLFNIYNNKYVYILTSVIDCPVITPFIINNWVDQFYKLNEPLEYKMKLIPLENLIFNSDYMKQIEEKYPNNICLFYSNPVNFKKI